MIDVSTKSYDVRCCVSLAFFSARVDVLLAKLEVSKKQDVTYQKDITLGSFQRKKADLKKKIDQELEGPTKVRDFCRPGPKPLSQQR